MSEELKLQLGDRMPAVLGLAADAMGQTTAEFLKNMEKGLVKSEEFLPKFTKALREMAAPGLDKAFKTMNTSFKRLTQNAKLFVKALFESGIGDLFTSIFNTLSNVFQIMSPVISLLGGLITAVLKPIFYVLEAITDAILYITKALDEALGGKLNEYMAMIGQIGGFLLSIFGKLASVIGWVVKGIGKLFRMLPSVRFAGSMSKAEGASGMMARASQAVSGAASKAGQVGSKALNSTAYRTTAAGVGGAELYQQKVAVEFTGEARDNLRQNKRESTVRTINTNSRP
ncbi:MAG: hypothetical protein Tp1111DCM1126091_106 [Prokaryotic dsDNA virus sp.]|nr:MAG: hypothetical protein Tp1111DCM1126091_106 [Prokaryotic dsDNA virus sp.]